MPDVFLPFFPFVNGTIISADEMNADLAALRDGTLSITGDTMSGSLIFNPDNLYDIGEPADHRPRAVYIGTSLSVPTGVVTTLTTTTLTAQNATVNDILNATHMRGFDVVVTGGVSAPNYYGGAFSGDGALLTNVAHSAANEIVTGSWTFTSPTFLQGVAPQLYFNEVDAAVDQKLWRWYTDAGHFYFGTANDAITVPGSVFYVSRTGVVPNVFVFGVNQVQVPRGNAATATVGLTFNDNPDCGWMSDDGVNPSGSYADYVSLWLGGSSRVQYIGQSWGTHPAGSSNTVVKITPKGGTLPSIDGIAFDSGGGTYVDGVTPVVPGIGVGAYGGVYSGINAMAPYISIGRNEYGAGAAGRVNLVTRSGGNYSVWIDNAGLCRVHTVAPNANNGASDVAGTIIGTQTSLAASKDLLGPGIAPYDALQKVVETPVYRFRYKQGFEGEEFDGIVTDDAPHFGMDQGKSLNTPNAIGYLIQAIKALHREIADLKGEGVVHA